MKTRLALIVVSLILAGVLYFTVDVRSDETIACYHWNHAFAVCFGDS